MGTELHGWDLGHAPFPLSPRPAVSWVQSQLQQPSGGCGCVEGTPPEGATDTKKGEMLTTPFENSTFHTSPQVRHRTHCGGEWGGGTALNSLLRCSDTHRRVAETEPWRVWLVWPWATWAKAP